MKILVIGNGFDLAHKLPTKYSDFLHFADCVLKLFSYEEVRSGDYKEKCLIKSGIRDDFQIILLEEYKNRHYSVKNNTVTCKSTVVSEMHELLHDNVWLSHFAVAESYLNSNWVDLESEMAEVIKSFEDIMRYGFKAGSSTKECQEKILQFIKNGKLKLSDVENVKESGLLNRMEKDLQKFIYAFELYLVYFVETLDIEKRLQQITNENFDYVLSFNYTDTFEKWYGEGKNIEYCYIHGKVGESPKLKTSRLVFGIDEYLEGKERDTNLSFVPFKKYFQRIMMRSGTEYYRWLKKNEFDYQQAISKLERAEYPGLNLSSFYDTLELYIFGHSLDKTDGDVLRKFITTPGMETNIYYFRKNQDDKEVLAKYVRNLITILGQDEVTKRCGEGTIRFIPQDI